MARYDWEGCRIGGYLCEKIGDFKNGVKAKKLKKVKMNITNRVVENTVNSVTLTKENLIIILKVSNSN